MDDFEIIFSEDQRDNQRDHRQTNDHRQTKQKKRVSFSINCSTRKKQSPEFKRELIALRKFEKQANSLFREAQRLPKSNIVDEAGEYDDGIWSERALNHTKRLEHDDETKRMKRIHNILDKQTY